MIVLAAFMVHTYTACTWCAQWSSATPQCRAFSITVGLSLLVASIWWWRAAMVKLRQMEAKFQEEEKLSDDKSSNSHAEEEEDCKRAVTRAEVGKINNETQRRQKENPAGMKTTWSGQIFIKTNTTVLIDVTSEDTVFSVKEKVPGVERLLFKGLDLDDESTLESYGIIKGQTLYAAMRSLGGGGGASKNKKAAGGRGSASDLSSKPPSGVIVRNNTDVEKVLKSLDIERVMAAMMFRDTDQDPLSAFFEMDKRQVKKGVVDAVEPIIELICAAINKKKVAKNDNSGGGKFNNPLQGGPIEEFYKGVTGVVGAPDPDLEKGVMQEHCQKLDSTEDFTTSNYGITTCPKTEYDLVLNGGKGLEKKMVTKDGQEMEYVIVKGTRGPCDENGQVQEDLRVLRPLEDYGVFEADGKLVDRMWGAGDEVKIEESLEVDNKSLEKGLVGRVVEGVGASAPCIKIDFGGDVGQVGVSKEQLFAQFCAKETQLQQTVRKARLTRVEVFVLVFYTGPMFLVYNAILRGFGTCGKVQEGIKFGCDEFWKSYSAFKVADRIAKSKNKFPSTIHVLASAIKKLQGSSENVQGSRLYRGLGRLDIRDFVKSRGFTERAFMSTTKSLKIAMEYSGIKDGKPASVLAMEVSKVDGGAVLGGFSQYPSEEETCWNACSYLEYVEGA